MYDLGNPVYFFLCERQVMTTRGRCLGFNEIEEIQQRFEGIVDLVGQRGTWQATGCGRSNSVFFFDTQMNTWKRDQFRRAAVYASSDTRHKPEVAPKSVQLSYIFIRIYARL